MLNKKPQLSYVVASVHIVVDIKEESLFEVDTKLEIMIILHLASVALVQRYNNALITSYIFNVPQFVHVREITNHKV